MADLSIKIKADFEGAISQFKELAQSSKATEDQIKAFTDKLKVKEFDDFQTKQKLIGVALNATGDSMKALTTQSDNYKREIERLIKGGMSPEEDMIKKLQGEYTRLQTEIDKTRQKNKLAEDGMKNLERAGIAAAAALGAIVTAAAASVQKTAEAGDTYAKTARVIGTTAETLQEFEYAAKRSGVESGSLYGAMEKLNKQIGDVKNGTGTLTKYLEDNNAELLDSLKNAKDNESAFLLVVDALKDTEDEFERAKLATEVFGKSGQDLIKMTADGAQGISDLREEARKYGIISNEAAGEAEKFMDAEENLKRAMTGLSNEIGAALMPKFTDIIQGAADMVSGIDDLEGKLRTATTVILSTATALGTFLAATKAAKAINDVKEAFKGLKTVLTGHPVALIASIIAAATVATIGLISSIETTSRRLKTLSTEMDDLNRKSRDAATLFGGLSKEETINAETALELIRLYPELAGKIEAFKTTVEEATTAQQGLSRAQALNKVNDMAREWQPLQKEIDATKDGIANMEAEQSKGNTTLGSSIERFKKKLSELEPQAKQSYAEISLLLKSVGYEMDELTKRTFTFSVSPEIVPPDPDAAAKAAREAAEAAAKAAREAAAEEAAKIIDAARKEAAKITGAAAATVAKDAAAAAPRTAAQIDADEWLAKNTARNADIIAEKEHADALAKIQSDYNEVWKTEQAAKAETAAQAAASEQLNIDIATAMLEEGLAKRKEIEDKARADKWLAENTARSEEIIAEKEKQEELARIQSDYDKKWKAAQEAKAAEEKALNRQKLKTAADLAGSMSQLIEAAGAEDRSAAIAARALASIEAAVNTALAVTKTYAEYGGTPLGLAAAAAIGIAGAAQIAKINSAPLPSAETGGRFEVPPTYTGVDSALMRVNAGEQVTVQPSGEGGTEQVYHIVLYLDGQPIVDFINRKSDTGEIRHTQARNV